MIPTVNVVQSFPVLITGRLDRQQLLKNYLESRESGEGLSSVYLIGR